MRSAIQISLGVRYRMLRVYPSRYLKVATPFLAALRKP